MIIRDIKSTKAFIDLNVVFTLINSVDDEIYILTKYHFEKMKKLIFAFTKERLNLVKQRIKNDQNTEKTANKTESFRKKMIENVFSVTKSIT